MPNLSIEIILLVVFATWHYSLFCGYISDDHRAVADRMDIVPDDEKVDRNESFWVKRFNDGIVMFYMNKAFWKMGFKNWPFPWHLFSLIIHIANTYLLYLFLYPIIGQDRAVMACGFWAVNPMLNQNVVWISGRPYILGAFLTLIALNLYQSPLVFVPYYLLAVVTNISIFFAPVLLWTLHPTDWQSRVYIMSMVLVAFPFLIWKFQKRFTNKALVIDRDNFRFKARKFNTFARIVFYYIFCLFVPTKMGWYHEAGFRYNEKWEKFNYLTLIGYIIIGYLIFYFKFPGWLFLLTLLPNSNLYATNSFVQDRYLYFCSIGIAVIVSSFTAQYPILFYCLMTFYATRAYSYSRHLKNDELLYRENWRNHAKSDYAVNNLSFFLIQQRRYDESRVVIERGLAINRMNKMLWYNLGITYAAQGNFANDEGKLKFIRALDCWKMALQIEPRWAKPANDLKRLIKILLDNKVLTLNPADGVNNISVTLPSVSGMQEIIHGTNNAQQATDTVPG